MTVKVRIATALLVRDGRALFVHRRASRRAYPDCWALPGGHIEAGERPVDAVSRECLEELGTRVRHPQAISITVTDPVVEMHAFLVTEWDGEPFNAAFGEHDGLGWFLPGELPRLTIAHSESLPDILGAVGSAVERVASSRYPRA